MSRTEELDKSFDLLTETLANIDKNNLPTLEEAQRISSQLENGYEKPTASLIETEEPLPQVEQPILQEEFQDQEPKKRIRVGKDAREKQLLAQELLNQQRQNEYLATRLNELEHIAQSQERQNKVIYDDSLNHKIALAQEALTKAEEEGDIASKNLANQYLTKFNIEKILAQKEATQKTQSYYKAPPPPPVYQEIPPQPTLNPNFEDFLDNNSWYDQSSPDFDPVLAQEIDHAADVYNRKLKIGRNSSYIGTKEYFNELETYIKNKYGEGEPAPLASSAHHTPSPQASLNRPAARVAPVGSYNSLPMEGEQSKTRIALTPLEKEIALSIHKVHPNGTEYTDDEKIKLYAFYK